MKSEESFSYTSTLSKGHGSKVGDMGEGFMMRERLRVPEKAKISKTPINYDPEQEINEVIKFEGTVVYHRFQELDNSYCKTYKLSMA